MKQPAAYDVEHCRDIEDDHDEVRRRFTIEIDRVAALAYALILACIVIAKLTQP